MINGLLNRLALACAAAGLTIATVLTLAHQSSIPLPCGGSNGCEQVAQDPSSMIGKIPVSVFGMAAYVILVLLAILRINGVALRACSIAGLFISLFGTLFSAVLTYHSVTVIHAICLWCIGSAAMMVLSTVAYLTNPKASKGIRDGGKPASAILWAIIPVLAIGGYAKFGHVVQELPPDLSSVKYQEADLSVLENSSHSLGSNTAPVTIVEFADLMCPACREMHTRLLLFTARNRGKARLLYHDFPLSKVEGHENSEYAASLSEQLNPDDFWQFISQVYNMQKKPTRPDLDKLLLTFHGKHIRDAKAAVAEVERNIKIGKDLGVELTPTYIIFINRKPASVASSVNLKDVIHEQKYIDIFQPARPKNAPASKR